MSGNGQRGELHLAYPFGESSRMVPPTPLLGSRERTGKKKKTARAAGPAQHLAPELCRLRVRGASKRREACPRGVATPPTTPWSCPLPTYQYMSLQYRPEIPPRAGRNHVERVPPSPLPLGRAGPRWQNAGPHVCIELVSRDAPTWSGSIVWCGSLGRIHEPKKMDDSSTYST